MMNMRQTLKVISLIFYLLSLVTLIGYWRYNDGYWYSNKIINVLPVILLYSLVTGGATIVLSLPIFANFFYAYLLFSQKKEKKPISATIMSILGVLAIPYMYMYDPEGIFGIGFVFWLVAILIMTVSAFYLGEEEITTRIGFTFYCLSFSFIAAIFLWADWLFQKSLHSTNDYLKHFGLLYSPSYHFPKFPATPFANIPILPAGSIVKFEGEFDSLYFPVRFLYQQKLISIFSVWGDKVLLEQENKNLKPEYIFQQKKLDDKTAEFSLIEVKNNQILYQQKVTLTSKMAYNRPYNPEIRTHTQKLFSQIQEEEHWQNTPLVDLHTLGRLTLKKCNPATFKVKEDKIKWQNVTFKFKHRFSNHPTLYCHPDYLGIWKTEDFNDDYFYLFRLQDMTQMVHLSNISNNRCGKIRKSSQLIIDFPTSGEVFSFQNQKTSCQLHKTKPKNKEEAVFLLRYPFAL